MLNYALRSAARTYKKQAEVNQFELMVIDYLKLLMTPLTKRAKGELYAQFLQVLQETMKEKHYLGIGEVERWLQGKVD